MAARELMDVREADLVGSLSWVDETLVVQLKGSADHASLTALEQLIDRAQSEARSARPVEAVVDIRELEFMNSSSLKVFVSWIADLHEEVDQTYKLKFLSNTKYHWQRRSLVSLRTFAVDRVIVEAT